MSVSNIYNQPGSQLIFLTLANNTQLVLQDDLGPCKIGIESDTGNLGYTDVQGVYHSIPMSIISILLAGAIPIGANYRIIQKGSKELWVQYSASGGVSNDWADESQLGGPH